MWIGDGWEVSKLKVNFFIILNNPLHFLGKVCLRKGQTANIIRRLFIVSKGIYLRNEHGCAFSYLVTDKTNVYASHLGFTEMKT